LLRLLDLLAKLLREILAAPLIEALLGSLLRALAKGGGALGERALLRLELAELLRRLGELSRLFRVLPALGLVALLGEVLLQLGELLREPVELLQRVVDLARLELALDVGELREEVLLPLDVVDRLLVQVLVPDPLRHLAHALHELL